MRQFRRVRRDKKTGVPSKYLTGARNRSAKAKEIKDTAEKYKKGQYIDIKAISTSYVLNKMTQTRRRKPLSQAVEKNLKRKGKKTRFTYGQLAQVYRRGQGAYLSSGSRNVSMAAWAMGRVNSFISGRGGARKADADILKKTPKKR